MSDLHCTCGSGCNKHIEILKAKIAELEAQVSYEFEEKLSAEIRIQELEERERWIPVSERPPKFPCTVFYSDSCFDSYDGEYLKIEDITDCTVEEDGYVATHWKPIYPPEEV